MDTSKEIAELKAEMRQEIVRLCEEERLIGWMVRNFGGDTQTWGIVQSLKVEDGVLVLRAGGLKNFGHKPFESRIPMDDALFQEDSEGTIRITGKSPSEWREWKFTK